MRTTRARTDPPLPHHRQNNLDYLNSLFNGFCQGKDGYSNEFVKFGNLKQCGN